MRLTTPFSFLRASRTVAGTTLLAGALLLGATLGIGKGAQSQTPTPTPPPPQKPLPTLFPPPLQDSRNPSDPTSYFQVVTTGDKQSPVNPFPFAGGNAQGRGVGSADMYWGMVNANVPYNQPPASRVPNASISANSTRGFPLQLDGWSFTAGILGFDPNSNATERRDPRANDPRSGSRNGQFLNQTAPLNIDDVDVLGANATTTWVSVTAPSQNFTNAGYSRVPAVTRPNLTALDYVVGNPTRVYKYQFNTTPAAAASARIPGSYGEQARLRISVVTPNLNTDPTAAAAEQRVSDARYIVFYYIRTTGGAILPKYKVFNVSQIGGGAQPLLNDDGAEAVFPFFSYQTENGTAPAGVATVTLPAQPGLGVPFQGVIVDNTTANPSGGGGIQYVLADLIRLTSSTGTISVTPTLIGAHGGRKNVNYNLTTDIAGVPVLPGPVPGTQPQQPRPFVPRFSTAPYNNKIVNEPFVVSASATNRVYSLTNDSYTDTNATTGVRDVVNTPGYINNPRDLIYNTTAGVGVYDSSIPFESWNPSTLFMGPESLLDPRRKTDPNSTTEIGLPLRVGTENRPLVTRIDPTTGNPIQELAPGGGTRPYRTPGNASDANNFNVYGGAFNANSTAWTPYFSQMQVIVARTDFVANPEAGVPDDQKDGTLTIQVGAVYALDWQTGAPIWRFPDKTYLPGRVRNPRIFTGIPNDPDPSRRQDVFQVANIVVVDTNNNGSNVALDPASSFRTTNDTDIEDEEVYIGQLTGSSGGGAGRSLGVGTGSGALFASITFAQRVPVQGRVQLPTYQISNPPVLTQFNRTGRYIQTNTGTTIPAPVGRYFNHTDTTNMNPTPNAGDGRAAFSPVLTGMLYIASNNGTIYAVDAFGNNDNYYAPYHPNLSTPNVIDNGVFGNYQPGTTNVLWTFNPSNSTRRQNESLAGYYARLKGQIPGTAGFGASAPVLAYAKDERDNTSATPANRINPFTDELRMFVGNSNGVLYALDASAQSGVILNPAGTTILDVKPLPFRKGDQVGFTPDDDATSGVTAHRTDLKWWFRTRGGAINYPPTVSLMRQKAGGTLSGNFVNGVKGVYASSQEGRVYCVDFFGPVTRQAHTTPVVGDLGAIGTSGAANSGWDGTAGAATLLNDDYYFHNTIPATANVRADLTEGDVRPRWAWPNLYRNTQAGTAKKVTEAPDFGAANADRQIDAYDINTVTPINIAGSVRLGTPEALGAPTSSPILMDFLWKDPLVLGGGAKLRSYVAVVMNDPVSTGSSVIASRVYLLDQVGDRSNFLSGTQTNKTGTNAPLAVRGQFVDRWTPNALLSNGDINGLTPTGMAWSYRTQYDVYPSNGTLLNDSNYGLISPTDLSGRNTPTTDPMVLSGDPTTTAATNNAFTGTSTNYPHYRSENYGRPERRTLPTLFVGGGAGNLFGLDIDPETGVFLRWRPTLADSRRFSVLPVSTYLTGTGTGDDLFPGLEATDDRRAVPVGVTNQYDDPFYGSGTREALRYRRVLARALALPEQPGTVANLTISGGPLQNRNNITPIAGTTPTYPTVPTYPTNDAPVLRPFLLTGDTAQNPPSFDPDIYANTDVRQFALSTRTNQDINDPITTQRGGVYSDVPPGPNRTRFIQAETTQRFFNQAYQYPGIFATTSGGLLYEVSSNIEGEDLTTFASTGESAAVAWGVQGLGTGLEGHQNNSGHTFQFIQNLGGGGTGPVSGIAVVTPAYFPALDPSFTNPTRLAAAATVPADNFRNYPYGSPNIIGAAGVTATPPVPLGVTTGNNDDPRPDFHVRPLSPGAVTQPGPDGMLGTADDIVAVLPDRHTGQTGFPLDLNGLFFDKRFAGNGTRLTTAEVGSTVYNESFIDAQATAPNTTILAPGIYGGAYPYPALNAPFATVQPTIRDPFTGQDPNGDYTVYLRLPAYSDIGTSLDTEAAPVARLFNNQQADGLRANRRSGNLVPLAEAPTERSLEPAYANDPLNNQTRGDDINPAGQNVTWIFTGGANGIFYAYTPAIPGQQTGFAGGQSEYAPIAGGPLGGSASNVGNIQVDLYDQTTYESIRSAAAGSATFTPPDRKLSIAAKGGRNFYEWGETAYIVLSNFVVGRQQNPSDPLSSLPVRISQNLQVHVTIRSRFGGPTVYDGDINPIRFNNQFSSYSVTEDDGSITKYGLAVLPFRLDEPTSRKPLTPGDVYDITAALNTGNDGSVLIGDQLGSVPTDPPGTGATSAEQLANSPASSFSIANPIAVQAFGVETGPSTATGQVMPVGVRRANAGDTTGGIGPFFADNNQQGAGNGTKGEVVDSRVTTKVDPDKIGGRYSQALTQGNTMRRRELGALLVDSGSANGYRLNPRFPSILKDADGGDEPYFYLPVASGVGYIDHGTNGSTTKGNVQLLRVANRSVLDNLRNVRIQAVSPLLWHAWPGQVPNTEGDLPAIGANPAVNHNNPRLTPVGMDIYGRINPLPWETGVNENEAYNQGSLANQSPDYPDIILQRTANTPRVFIGGTDVSNSVGSLPANITDNSGSRVNNSVGFIQNLLGPGGVAPVTSNQAVSVTLAIPKYQSANLVAIHSLTATNQVANNADDPKGPNNQGLDIIGKAGQPGPVQLPRGYASRLLYEANTAGTAFDGPQAISPWGYSTRMVAYVDIPGVGVSGSLLAAGQTQQSLQVSGVGNSNPNTSIVKAYREFEVWVGVPAAMSIRMVEKEVDLGAEGHGFAMQQGLLGYGVGGGAYASGFLPTPLYNATAFPAVGNITPNPPYSNYFKSFTTVNDGNINLWNLRSSQKIEVAQNIAQAGTGQPFQYFGMRSDSVDSRFGILAVGADPTLAYMPQVVTSLDPSYDLLWDTYIKNLPAFQAQYNGAGSDPYTRYYAAFQGHHTLHKALPGATSPSVLGVPDIPTAQNVYDIAPALAGQAIPPAPPSSKTVVGVAVPLGTPSGLYHSNLANAPLVVFEDHDTDTGYNAVPTITSGGNLPTLSPSGPLYGGRNNYYFADPAAPTGAVPVRTKGGVSDGTLRARRFNTASGKLEYQPYTDPTFDLRVTVKETGLTGQVADRALAAVGGAYSLPPVISTGVLPSVDPFPLIQTVTGGNQTTGGDLYRAASALTPAAYRSANGTVHVYFPRNAANGVVDTQPGKPYGLFASHLNWNQNLGVFVANNVGVPIAGDARSNTRGSWFTSPTEIVPTGVPAGSSNVTPFVLQEMPFSGGLSVPGSATLFFMNSTPTVGGAPVNIPYFAPLDVNGGLASQPVPFFDAASPTLQRYAPRAVYVPQSYDTFTPNTGTTFLFYYGGVPGRWNIYYSPRAASTGGAPTDAAANDANGRAELPLSVPTAIVSASDPTPIVRRLYTSGTNNPPVTTIDLYYTAILRSSQTPDVFMTRYELQEAGGGAKRAGQAARLVPVTLPRVYGEKLTAPGRDPLWQARHISWVRDLGRNSLPVITIDVADTTSATGRRQVRTVRGNWRYDNASGLLYQTFLFNPSVAQSLTTVYVDTSAGTVRFRGAGTPRNTDTVYAEYQPQTYRITGDGASNAGTFSLVDQSVLPATLSTSPINAIVKRTQPMYADRQYILYQKGAQPGKPATLYYSARRVGVDLKTLTTDANGVDLGAGYPLAANETIGLDVPTAGNNFNSTPQVSNVTINGTAVPYDVDITNGRIYVAPLAPASAASENVSYENLAASFSITAAKPDGTTRTVNYNNVRLTYLDEKRDVAVPMTQAVNESQPYAFIDGFVPTVSRPGNNPNPSGDPTLQPGRMWLFWSTPRGREGTVIGPGSAGGGAIFDPFPSAYDIFWQTLAPQYDPLLYTISR